MDSVKTDVLKKVFKRVSSACYETYNECLYGREITVSCGSLGQRWYVRNNEPWKLTKGKPLAPRWPKDKYDEMVNYCIKVTVVVQTYNCIFDTDVEAFSKTLFTAYRAVMTDNAPYLWFNVLVQRDGKRWGCWFGPEFGINLWADLHIPIEYDKYYNEMGWLFLKHFARASGTRPMAWYNCWEVPNFEVSGSLTI
jgi:hypothetical protein